MNELGVLRQCQYPGFPNEPLDPFVRLAHDLGFAGKFLSGDARTLEQMRVAFREHAYAQVVQLAQTLALPNKMTASQRRMLEIATIRTTSETDRSYPN